MLQQLREASRGWVAATLMGLLVISFAIWGIADIFRVGTTTAVAEVGSDELSLERLKREVARTQQQIGEQQGRNVTAAEMAAMGLDRAALDGLVEQMVISHKLRDLGLSASDDQIRSEIRSAPAFQAGGQFDRSAFDRFLDQSNYTESDFIERVRTSILSQQLINLLHAGPSLPGGYIGSLVSYQNERRVAEYVTIAADRAGVIPDPGDEALKKFIQENEAEFTAPESRSVSYVAVRPEDLMPTVKISEDQIKSVYDAQKARFSTPEKRVLEQIQFPSKEAAEAAKKKIDGGAPFATVATEVGFKPEDIALGEVNKGDPSIPTQAFEIPAGSVSAPLEGPFGWVLIRAVSVTPGTEKAFDSVRQEIRDALARQEAVELVREESNKVEDALGAGMSLEEVAKEVNYPMKTIPAIDASGRDASGKQIEGLASDSVFLTTAFDKDRGAGEESELTPAADDSYFVLRVDTIKPAAVKDFAQIRTDALKGYQAQERDKKLAALADELAKKGNAGTAFETIATDLGEKIKSSDPIARQTNTEQFSESVVDALYAAKPNSFVSGKAGQGEGYVVGKLVDVGVVKTDSQEERTAFANALQRNLVGDFVKQFTESSRAELDTKVNEDLFKTIQPQEQ